jgi:hypothetical protein
MEAAQKRRKSKLCINAIIKLCINAIKSGWWGDPAQ